MEGRPISDADQPGPDDIQDVWIEADSVVAAANTSKGCGSGAGPEQSEPAMPPSTELPKWVVAFVNGYEAWDRIPACWAQHGAVAEEMEACWKFGLILAMEAGGDIKAQAHGQADFWDYVGRMMDRLALTPGAMCASEGKHCEPATWDKEDSAARRRAARQIAQGYGPGSVTPKS